MKSDALDALDAAGRKIGLVEIRPGSEDSPERRLTEIPPDHLAEFEAAARRPLAQRFRYAFVRTHKPVLDEARYRSFDSMEEYRKWCAANLPDWLGYGRV